MDVQGALDDTDLDGLSPSQAYISQAVKTRHVPTEAMLQARSGRKRRKRSLGSGSAASAASPVGSGRASPRIPESSGGSRQPSAHQQVLPESHLESKIQDILRRIDDFRSGLDKKFHSEPAEPDIIQQGIPAGAGKCTPPKTSGTEPGGDVPPASPKEGGVKITLTVQCAKGSRKIRAFKHDPFSKIFAAFVQCALTEGWIEDDHMRYVFDGEVVAGSSTPAELELEGDEMIEAYAETSRAEAQDWASP